MRFSSPRFFWWVLAPMALLVVLVWWRAAALDRRAGTLAGEATRLRADLDAGGFTGGAPDLEARLTRLREETRLLRSLTSAAEALGQDAFVRENAARPFQLIEFERERAAVAQAVRERAAAAGVKIAPSAFEVLADTTESPPQPRRRWAQLAVAREVALRAVAAKVGGYEALPVPAVREMRVARDSPVLVIEILFSARVTGDSARVQDFVEYLALGSEPGDLRFVIEHLVLRKDGTDAPDQASATVVIAGLLPPPTEAAVAATP